MSLATNSNDTVPVWDLFIRLFHWTMAGLVVAGLWTGLWAPEWWLERHVFIGYAIAALLSLRVIWGFAGPHWARWTSLPLHPALLVRHLVDLARCRPGRHIGHNPAGSWMIVTLLVVLIAVLASGLLAYGGIEKLGPLSALIDSHTGRVALRLHWLFAYAIIALVAIHVVGVIAESLLERQNLAAAMITGRKHLASVSSPIERNPDVARPSLTPGLAAAVTVTGITVTTLAWGLEELPPTGWRPLSVPQVYVSECGECHSPYHPSLLPAASWRAILADLGDHFGEDASLDAASRRRIEHFLTTAAAWPWDTEAANGMRATVTGTTTRITDSAFWRRRHAGIAKSVFSSPAVGSRINCSACHLDAATGRFDDAQISIPKPRHDGDDRT